jgi:uncharacterized protein (TIGR02145 family)
VYKGGGDITEIEIEGKIYPVVKIGNLYIMAENLDAPGNLPIGGAPNYKITTPHAYYYKNDELNYGYNGRKYGLFYNGYSRNYLNEICPEGWRVTTNNDLQYIVDFVGQNNGAKLKTTEYWTTPGNNEYKFSAPPSSATDTGNNWFFGETFFYLQGDVNYGQNKYGIFRIVDNNTIEFFAIGASMWISCAVRFCTNAT